ncbi:MAG: alkaline phosphatase family protein [Thermoplasmata archaeon]
MGRREGLHLALAVAIVTLTILAGGGTPLDAGRPGVAAHVPSRPLSVDGTRATSPPPPFPTPIRHVVEVFLENDGLSQVLAHAPFETHLWNTYAHATAFYGLCHPSLGNYISATSGTATGCGGDNYEIYDLANIADLVNAHGLSWMSFAENMSAPCSSQNSTVFSNVFTPLLHYHDIVGDPSYCAAHIQPVTPGSAWYQDINGTMPNFVWYAPNKIDNGHSSNLTVGDTWLENWLSPLLNAS